MVYNGITARKKKGTTTMQNFIQASLDYIEQNLKTDIAIEELAQMMNYSITHYCRIFRRVTGFSVAKYIAKKRINHALSEISSGRKVVDAVLDYGFDTYSGFYKAFVKMYGCSPKKYLTFYKNLTPKELEEIIMDYNLYDIAKAFFLIAPKRREYFLEQYSKIFPLPKNYVSHLETLYALKQLEIFYYHIKTAKSYPPEDTSLWALKELGWYLKGEPFLFEKAFFFPPFPWDFDGGANHPDNILLPD